MGSTWRYEPERSMRTGTGDEFYRTPAGTLVVKTIKRPAPAWKAHSPIPSPSSASTYRHSFTKSPKNKYDKPITSYHPDSHRMTKACKPQMVIMQTNESSLRFEDPHLRRKPKHHFKTTYSSSFSPVKVPTHFHSNSQVLAHTTTFIHKQQEK